MPKRLKSACIPHLFVIEWKQLTKRRRIFPFICNEILILQHSSKWNCLCGDAKNALPSMGEPGLFLREEDMINGFIAHLQGQNDLPGMVGRYEQDLPAILQGPAGSQVEAKQEEAGWKGRKNVPSFSRLTSRMQSRMKLNHEIKFL